MLKNRFNLTEITMRLYYKDQQVNTIYGNKCYFVRITRNVSKTRLTKADCNAKIGLSHNNNYAADTGPFEKAIINHTELISVAHCYARSNGI